jgi:hypothetical protein
MRLGHSPSCPSGSDTSSASPGIGVVEVQQRLAAGREFQDAVREVLAANAQLLVLARQQRKKKKRKRH